MKSVPFTRRSLFWTMAAFAVLVCIASSLGGFYAGSKSNWAVDTAYRTGYDQASYNYCNLKFGDGHKAFTDDGRTYPGAAKDTVVADAVCTDDQIRSWNESNEQQGSKTRACRIDWSQDALLGIVGSAPCVAPVAIG